MSRSDGNGVAVMDDSRRAGGLPRRGRWRAWAWAARTRWVSRRALVTGPTPPGTGVIAEATGARGLEVDVADELVADDVDADVDDDRARAQHLPGDEARDAGGHDHDLGARGCARARSTVLRVADRDGRVLAQQQQGGGLADDVRAADDDDAPARERDARALEDLDRGVRGRRQEALVAEASAGRR